MMLLLLVGLNLFFAGFQFYHSYMHWLFNNRALRYKLNVDKRRNPSELCIMQSLALHSNQYKSIRRQEKAWVWVFNLSYHLRCVGFDFFSAFNRLQDITVSSCPSAISSWYVECALGFHCVSHASFQCPCIQLLFSFCFKLQVMIAPQEEALLCFV